MTGNKTRTNRQILLVERPSGKLEERHFKAVDETIGEPGPGEVLCRTVLLSIDPANRAWMRGRTYRAQLGEGDVMAGFTLAEVVAENGTKIPVGTVVACESGWQEYAIHPANRVQPVSVKAALTHHMSVLGVTGLTAYFGLLEVGRPKAGETVVVSGAAGAVGSLVGQIAKIQGCRAVGIAGTDEKVQWLTGELGFDAAFNYKTVKGYRDELAKLCPAGIDCYFDNVGGTISDAVMALINQSARIAICGQISQYNLEKPEMGPRLLGQLIVKRARIEGFLVTDYGARFKEGLVQMAAWLREGKLIYREQFTEGIESAPQAFLGLLQGANTGKQLVRVAAE